MQHRKTTNYCPSAHGFNNDNNFKIKRKLEFISNGILVIPKMVQNLGIILFCLWVMDSLAREGGK